MIARREWLGAGMAALAACARRTHLPILARVPPFQLTAQNGAPFDSETLRGNPWLASFFFASCNGPCPRMNRTILDIQERTYSYQRLRIVSFTVDPEHDTPGVLADYAQRYKADPARWFFLTGKRETISSLARDAFLVGALDTAQSHSTRVMLVDAQSRLRGHFATAEKEDVEALLAGISSVYKEDL